MTFSDADVVAMERAAARAWPAGQSLDVDGWQVRLSGGGTRRANSVLPLAFKGHDCDAAITQVEALYRSQQTRSYFQVSSLSQPLDLDARLAARGYAFEEPCLLLAKRLTQQPIPGDIEINQGPTAPWLGVYFEPLDVVRQTTALAVLAKVPEPRAFLLLTRDGLPLSSALAVVSSDGTAMVECVATRAAAQRLGGGRHIMAALEAWAVQQGAVRAALQVAASNERARALYAKLGYSEVGRYHYRWRDVD